MSEEEGLQVNPNTAAVEVLVNLPGVGEVLARRIVEARPFTKVEDMLQVPGLGEATMARLIPYLTFGEELEPIKSEEEPDKEETIEETAPDIEPSAEGLMEEMGQILEAPGPEEEKPEKIPQAKMPPTVRKKATYSRGATLWLVLGTTVISVALSVLLSLSILGGINRTLNIGQHSAVRQLENDLVELEADLNDLSSRIEAIDRRMQAVEGLSGRVTAVERKFDALSNEVRQSLDHINSVTTLIDDLAREVGSLSKRMEGFEAFLDGLRQLLMGNTPTTEP